MKVKIYQWLDNLMNVIVISLVLILGILPIITFFPTIVGLLGMLIYHEKENLWTSRIASFFYFFKKNFKLSLSCQILFVLILLVGRMNIIIANTMSFSIRITILSMTFFFVSLMILMMANILFSLLVNPEKKIKDHFKYSILLIIIKLPKSMILLLSFFVGGTIILIIPQMIILTLGANFLIYLKIEKDIWKEVTPIEILK